MGLREVKKERTRRAIEDAAIALFAERGYQATTVADIAAAADIAPRTFFAYYRSKEDVLFGDADQTFDELEAHLHERPAGEPTFDALRRWIDEGMTDDLAEAQDREQTVREIVAANDGLQARERRLMGRFEDLLAAAVATDLGDEPSALRPRMVAAAAVAALWCLRDGDDGRPADHDRALERLDEALAFLRAGTAALVAAVE
jgi:AcrR family transcriptional regulator